MAKFKVGDKVYFPMRTIKVCTLTETKSMSYPLSVFLNRDLEACTTSGELYENSGISCIFHATEENRKLLEKLHGVEFEAVPPKTRTVTFEIPETFIPSYNEEYWFILASATEGVDCQINTDSLFDRVRIRKGVWRTKEQALMVANAIFNAD